MALPTAKDTYDNKMPGLWEEVATGGSLPVDDTFFYVDTTLVDCMGENIYSSGLATGTDAWGSGLATGTDSWSGGFPSAATSWTYEDVDPGDEDSGGSLLVSNTEYYANETVIDCLGRNIWS